MRDAAETLYRALTDAGVATLYDDCSESAGVKFNDADLLGLPWRVTVSPRALDNNAVELKQRRENESALIPVGDALQVIFERARA